jgi:hypothetical protein
MLPVVNIKSFGCEHQVFLRSGGPLGQKKTTNPKRCVGGAHCQVLPVATYNGTTIFHTTYTFTQVASTSHFTESQRSLKTWR